MGRIILYARVSHTSQDLIRQEKRLREAYPNADILFEDKYTGTRLDKKRADFMRMMRGILIEDEYGQVQINEHPGTAKCFLKPGDTIVMDSVSRFSRNAEIGFQLYKILYEYGVDLVFRNEPYINTQVYRSTMQLALVGQEIADVYIEATNKVLWLIAKQTIHEAFAQSEKEVSDLHKRTKDGLYYKGATSKRAGDVPEGEELRNEDGSFVRPGKISIAKKGQTYKIKMKDEAKQKIRDNSKSFGGSLGDKDCMLVAKVSFKTFYKYKAEIREEISAERDRKFQP